MKYALVFGANLGWGTPSRAVSFDIAAGLPQTLAVEAQVQVSNHWQIGFGYGLLPILGALSPELIFAEQSITLFDGNKYFVRPTAKTSMNILSPFVRFFPTERNVYFELTGAMLRVEARFSSSISDGTGMISVPGALSGSVMITQLLPTISLGHFFAGKLFFANLSLGVSFLSSIISSVSLNSAIPDALGGNTNNQAALDRISAEITKGVTSATKSYREKIFLIPSIRIAFGFLL